MVSPGEIRSATVIGKLEHVTTEVFLSAVEHVHVHVGPVVGQDAAVTAVALATENKNKIACH